MYSLSFVLNEMFGMQQTNLNKTLAVAKIYVKIGNCKSCCGMEFRLVHNISNVLTPEHIVFTLVFKFFSDFLKSWYETLIVE